MHAPVYKSTLIRGKTVGIIGLGGIGVELSQLARGDWMRVVATRWSASFPMTNVDGVNLLLPAAHVLELLTQSTFVVVSVQWTPEADRLIGTKEFAAMKPTTHLVSISSGETIDEQAPVTALDAEQLAGTVLDVYCNEAAQPPPPPEQWRRPEVLITPHTSYATEPELSGGYMLGIEVFVQNLQALSTSEPLADVVD